MDRHYCPKSRREFLAICSAAGVGSTFFAGTLYALAATWGAGGFQEQAFNDDATVVKRLDEAGAPGIRGTPAKAQAVHPQDRLPRPLPGASHLPLVQRRWVRFRRRRPGAGRLGFVRHSALSHGLGSVACAGRPETARKIRGANSLDFAGNPREDPVRIPPSAGPSGA
jgi:hypothetical protein